MKKLTLTIDPKVGFGELKFGNLPEDVTKILGEAEDMEDFSDQDDFNTLIMNYWEQGLSVFFEGKEKNVLSCFETEEPDATLFGNKIFDMGEDDIIALMADKGFEVAEAEDDESGERRISYDDALIDFFFQDEELVAVNWGVLVDEAGNIEEM